MMHATMHDLKTVLYNILQQNNIVPKYFGLGFIQCKINENYRAHFYHPDIKPIVNIKEEIHDHRYNFTSYIVKGKLTNITYDFIEDDNGIFVKQFESCNKDIEVIDNKITNGNIFLKYEQDITEGNNYFMDHTWFHTVETDKCVTLLSRTNYMKEYSNVIRPINQEKICPFSKNISEDECWKIIKELLEIK